MKRNEVLNSWTATVEERKAAQRVTELINEGIEPSAAQDHVISEIAKAEHDRLFKGDDTQKGEDKDDREKTYRLARRYLVACARIAGVEQPGRLTNEELADVLVVSGISVLPFSRCMIELERNLDDTGE